MILRSSSVIFKPVLHGEGLPCFTITHIFCFFKYPVNVQISPLVSCLNQHPNKSLYIVSSWLISGVSSSLGYFSFTVENQVFLIDFLIINFVASSLGVVQLQFFFYNTDCVWVSNFTVHKFLSLQHGNNFICTLYICKIEACPFLKYKWKKYGSVSVLMHLYWYWLASCWSDSANCSWKNYLSLFTFSGLNYYLKHTCIYAFT